MGQYTTKIRVCIDFRGLETVEKVFFDKLKPPAGAGGLEKSLFGAFALGLAVAIAVAVAVLVVLLSVFSVMVISSVVTAL